MRNRAPLVAVLAFGAAFVPALAPAASSQKIHWGDSVPAGFAGWGVLDEYFRAAGADGRSVVYPIYKYFKVLE
jgi:hypothetical protein